MDAEIIAIGSELLLGETVDTNSAYIARQLTSLGVNLFRKAVIGDNQSRIAQAIAEALGRADLVICTGGLGPTVDDMTREAVAMALGRELERRDELVAQIEARFSAMGRTMSPSNLRQAYVPGGPGVTVIENPRGTAPSFVVEDARGTVIVLPGVPHEMRYLMEHAVLPYLRDVRGQRQAIVVRTLRATGLGESVIGERIADFMQGENPTVGISAKKATYEIRVAAKAEDRAAAEALIDPVAEEIARRLDGFMLADEKLEQVVGHRLVERGLSLAIYEGQAHAPVFRAFAADPEVLTALRGVEIHPLDRPLHAQAALTLAASGAEAVRERWRTALALGVQVATTPEDDGFTTVGLVLLHPAGVERVTRRFDLKLAEGWEFVGTAALELVRTTFEA
jgi:nicotinamide-nucleotide amidase